MSEYVNANGEKEELNPGDYDFQVAERASQIENTIQHQEGAATFLGDVVEGRIAQSAGIDLEGEQARKVAQMAGYTNEEVSEKLDAATEKIESATDFAKQHYQQNKDQYVVNAKQEYAIEQQAEEKEDRVEDARDDVEDALEGADKEKIPA